MQAATPAVFVKLVLTALFWGATWIAGRVVVQEMPPLSIASWRFLLASALLGALLVAREGWPRWSPRQWLLLSTLGLTGVLLYNVFFLYALQRVEAGRGALVVAFIPAIVALADWVLFRVAMTRLKATGVCLALYGCLLVVTAGDPTRLLTGDVGSGEWLLVGTALSWTAYTLLSRYCSASFTPLAMTFGGCLTGYLMLTAAALAQGSLFDFAAASWRGVASVVFLGVFGTAIAFTGYSQAIGKIGSTKTAAFINLVPIFAVLLGALLLGERLGAAILSGGALVICGVLLTNRRGRGPVAA